MDHEYTDVLVTSDVLLLRTITLYVPRIGLFLLLYAKMPDRLGIIA